ncbi:MAG: ABC transporter permease [Pseudomonadota bacterium]|nr:ABC transporter permease [Pseudomonadota bacterium]
MSATEQGIGATGFWAVVRRELRYLASQRGDRLLVLWLPLLLSGLVWWIFSTGVPRDLPVAVVDQDQSSLSQRFVQLVDAMPSVAVYAQQPDVMQADQALKRRQVYAVLVIPHGFAAQVGRGQSAPVILNHNAQYASHSGQISRDIQTAVVAMSSVIGSERLSRSRGVDAAVMASTVRPIQVHAAPLYRDVPDYELFLAATLLPALLNILIMIGAVSVIGRELRDATAGEWLQTAGGSVACALVAKLLPYCLLYSVWALVYVTWFRVWGESPIQTATWIVVLGALLLVTASMALGVLMIGLTLNLRMGLSLTGFYTAPAFAYSGQAFPLVAMPAFPQFWASILPLTHWLAIYNQGWLAGAPLRILSTPLWILGLMTVLPLVLGYLLIKRRAFNPTAWGAR